MSYQCDLFNTFFKVAFDFCKTKPAISMIHIILITVFNYMWLSVDDEIRISPFYSTLDELDGNISSRG